MAEFADHGRWQGTCQFVHFRSLRQLSNPAPQRYAFPVGGP